MWNVGGIGVLAKCPSSPRSPLFILSNAIYPTFSTPRVDDHFSTRFSGVA